MPTSIYQVAAANDDGDYQFGSCYRSNASVRIAGSNMPKATFRFDGIALQKGHKVSSARLYLKAASTHEYSMNTVRLGCEDTDDAGDLVSQCDASARVMTTAYTAWNETKLVTGNLWYWSPDFAASVQEIIERVGWASGNAIAVLGVPFAASGTAFSVLAYETAAASAAKLYITYGSLAGGAML